MRAIERDEDYFAHQAVFAPRQHVAGAWSTLSQGPPDRIVLVRGGEIDRMLQGLPPTEVLQEWLPGTDEWPIYAGQPDESGLIQFDMPAIDCSEPRGGCHSDSIPHVVWLRGRAWVGAEEKELRGTRVEYEDFGRSTSAGGVVHFPATTTRPSAHAATPWLIGAVFVGAGVAIASISAWAILARRAPATARPAPTPPGAEAMLHFLQVAELYVATIARYFIVSAAVIVVLGIAGMYLMLPGLLAQAEATLSYTAYKDVAVFTFALAIPFLVAVAFAFWFAQYSRVRRELRRWREQTARFEAETARILQA
jgi:hypothetical protein